MIPKNPKVAAALLDLLVAFPMRSRKFGVNVLEKATDIDFTEAFRQLLSTDRYTTVELRFKMGDLYNQIPKRNRAKNTILAPIYAEFGAKFRQLLSTYGWVARKWPEAERSDKYPWSWWVRNYRNEKGVICEHAPKSDDRVQIVEVCSEQRNENGDVTYFAEFGGKRCGILVPIDNGHTIFHRSSGADATADERAEYPTEAQAEEFETA